MKIKAAAKQGLFLEKINSLIKSPRRKRWIALFAIVLTLVIILVSIYFGMVLRQKGLAHILNEIIHSNPIAMTSNYFRGLAAAPEHITINIKYMDYQKLAYKRETALVEEILQSSPEDYVPATIQYKDKTVMALIRLKGDVELENLSGKKWSFRIKVRGNDALFGMKRFSIHPPKERNYIYEWIMHQALKREEILSLRYKFIKVTLNGEDLGIYALEEHFEKELIENNRRREGPIIKFNEDIFWARVAKKKPTTLESSQFSADIDAFKMDTILKTPHLYRQFIIAKDLLESFRRGKLPVEKVFDVEKLAKHFAISDLIGARHGAGVWNNLRFYYNPITSLLEPIGFDTFAGRDISQSGYILPLMAIKSSPNSFHARLFNDTVFFEEYMKALEQILQKPYLDKLFEDIDTELQKNLRIIYSESPYFIFSKEIFYRNQTYLRAVLNPIKGIHAYFHKFYNAQIDLSLGNIQPFPIEVLGISYKNLLLPPFKKTILPPNVPLELVSYQMVTFSLPENLLWSDTMIAGSKVKYRLLGTGQIRYETIFPYPNLSNNFIENDFIRQPPNAHRFKFLSIDESVKRIFIRPGNWNLTQNLIIPKGYVVVCPEGVQLNISNSATILSFSALEFIGSQDRPIIIRSEGFTGQGIVVMNAGQKSILNYVVFENLSNPSEEGWELTGAVTFYESAVEINYCRFSNNNSEDGLNIVRSDFLIDKTLFERTSSDALDADFSNGKITNSSFVDSGGDAIDIAGSLVELKNILINHIGDKGLSVGEDSKMTASGVEIKNVEMAIASKDSSELNINNATLSNCKIGLAVYQKKPEFGPASIRATGLIMEEVNQPHLVEEGSQLNISGKNIKSDQQKVREALSKYIRI